MKNEASSSRDEEKKKSILNRKLPLTLLRRACQHRLDARRGGQRCSAAAPGRRRRRGRDVRGEQQGRRRIRRRGIELEGRPHASAIESVGKTPHCLALSFSLVSLGLPLRLQMRRPERAPLGRPLRPKRGARRSLRGGAKGGGTSSDGRKLFSFASLLLKRWPVLPRVGRTALRKGDARGQAARGRRGREREHRVLFFSFCESTKPKPKSKEREK